MIPSECRLPGGGGVGGVSISLWGGGRGTLQCKGTVSNWLGPWEEAGGGGGGGEKQEASSGMGVTHPPAREDPEVAAGGRATWHHLLGSCPGSWKLLVLALSPMLCDSGNCLSLGFSDHGEQRETGLLPRALSIPSVPSNPTICHHSKKGM